MAKKGISKKAGSMKTAAKKMSAKKAPSKKTVSRSPKKKVVKKTPKKTANKISTKNGMVFSVAKAKTFVSRVKLPKAPIRRGADEEKKPVPFTEGIDQSLVVGSNIVSFAKDLAADQRSLIVNSLLLAQLAASAKIKNKENIKDWYSSYFETLGKIGWLIQNKGFSEYEKEGSHLEVHKAIIKVAAIAFGPATTALAMVTATLEAMKEMSENAPWMTIFRRSSESSKVARFQVTTAEPSTEGGTMISMMAFELSTTNKLTQVLFFKYANAEVTFRHADGKVTLEKSLAATLAPTIERRVTTHLLGNIESIEI